MLSANNLHDKFELLAANKWCLLAIDKKIAAALRNCAEQRLADFKPAGVGSKSNLSPDLRSDRIFWLKPEATDLNNAESTVLSQIEILRKELREYLRLSLDEFECHFSVYEAGAKYVRHKDTTLLNNKRVVSFVIYLNENWSPEFGGQIIGYNSENSQLFKVEPEAGTMVLFLSELEHEVVEANKRRFALTGWLRRK